MRRRGPLYAIATLAILLCAYLGLWIYSASWFDREIDRIYAQAERNGVRFLGPKPALGNFPFMPEIFYTGGIQTGNAIIAFPELRLRGYPIPGMTLHAEFPAGIALDGVADPKIWVLDELNLDLAIPFSWPRSFTYPDLVAWRDDGGDMTVRHYSLVKEELRAQGSGSFAFDAAMQPVFRLDADITGHEAFVEMQVRKGMIAPFAGAVATAMLNSFTRPDEPGEQRTISVSVSVEDRILQVGSMQVLTLPEIVWGTHTMPVPRL